MRQIGEDGSGHANAATASPLLMECDRHGRVLWLSEPARLWFGDPENLVDTVLPDATVRLTLVLETKHSLLISLQLSDLAERLSREEKMQWSKLREDFVHNCRRLQELERGISTLARKMRRGSGARAVLQIDLARQRLGRELHTGVGQMLVAIRTQLEIVNAQLPAPPHPVQAALERVSTLLGQALEQVRDTSRKLHPPEWQRLTLPDALRQLWELSAIPQRYETTLDLQPLPHEPALEVKVLMYRAAQEALSNLVQHSQATRIRMTLAVKEERLVMSVEDNGVGFDVGRQFSAPANVASRIGLRSIREEAESLGGSLEIESGPAGTRLEVTAPFGP